MLQLFLFLGFGLLLAAIYKAVADKSEHKSKLERVRREIAWRKAEAEARRVQSPDQSQ